MTHDELFALWDSEVVPHIYKRSPGGGKTWERITALSADAQAFLRGEDVPWPADICVYYPDSYPEFCAKELDGENRDLALRMLAAYDKLVPKPLCRTALDVKVCKALGMSFTDLCTAFINMGNRRPADFAAGAVTWYPEEAEALVRDFSYELGVFEKGVSAKNPLLFPAILYMTLDFIRADNSRFASLLPGIEQIIAASAGNIKVSDDHRFLTWHILYEYHALSPELTRIYQDELLKGNIGSYVGNFLSGGELEAHLAQLGLPAWLYPMMIAREDANPPEGLSGPAYLEKLYAEDPRRFVETYRAFLEYKDRKELWASMGPLMRACHAFKFLAILFQHNDAALASEAKQMLEKLLPALNADLAAKLREEREPWENRTLHAYTALYEHIPPVRQMLDTFFDAGRAAKPPFLHQAVFAFFEGRGSEWFAVPPGQSARLLLDSGTVSVKEIFAASVNAGSWYASKFMPPALVVSLIKAHHDAAVEFFAELGNFPVDGVLAFLDAALQSGAGIEASVFPRLLAHKSKQVIKKVERFLADKEGEARAAVEALRPKLKGPGALAARRLVKQWDAEKQFGTEFAFTGSDALSAYCRSAFDDEAKKLIAWIGADQYRNVRYADRSGAADPAVMGCLLSEYLFLEEPGRLVLCDKIAAGLDKADLEAALKNLYQAWLAGGADTKKKLILAPCCIYGSDGFILEMKKQIEEWTKQARSALASFAVFCIALNGGSVALLTVDGYTNRAPNNQVKNTAREAFAFAARELGVTQDELSDRIVPGFGFNERGEKILDYGPRSFLIHLTADFSLAVYEAETAGAEGVKRGKAIKSLPAPGAKDDRAKAEAAKKEFAELKKSLKAVVQNQTARLERILLNGRKWTPEAWKKLFVANPVMHRFAEGLVWGVYDGTPNGAPRECFRYMSDGSFADVHDENFTLPADSENCLITLVHPIELDEAARSAWQRQLEDYEIIQPVNQLGARWSLPGEKDVKDNIIVRYRKKATTAGKILGLAKQFNMQRGDVGDGGSYNYFTLADETLHTGVVLGFDYLYMGIAPGETTTLEEVAFYRFGEDGDQPALRWGDSVRHEDAVPPASLPLRYVAGMLGLFDRLLESGGD
ncbi:MAG: DUF4132 domain-containing protein [Treponema sp.]|jgi:hypothetical protein|nr:DUF4132 domain-containing protein [Treponema sp.]